MKNLQKIHNNSREFYPTSFHVAEMERLLLADYLHNIAERITSLPCIIRVSKTRKNDNRSYYERFVSTIEFVEEEPDKSQENDG